VAYVGNLSQCHGFFDLVKAIKIAKRSFQEAKLFLIASKALGYALLGYYYCEHRMSTNQFASVTMVVALSIPALVLLLKPPRDEGDAKDKFGQDHLRPAR
jgi:hypothetical protein